MRRLIYSVVALVSLAGFGAASWAADPMPEYRIGGPLAGLKLPLFPTQFGEPAGYPGCVPELRATLPNGTVSHVPGGMAPQEYLYPGSVEHWHAYWFKYLPLQPMFTQQSLLKNWIAKDVPGVSPAQTETYAEPVYWVPRFQDPENTGRTLDPVSVVRAKVGAPVFELDCGTLDPGLYALCVIGAVETKYIQRQRLPLYLSMKVNDGLNGEVNTYRIRGPYVDDFYAVAEIYFHAPDRRAYRATITLDEGTQVDLLIHNIDLHNVLAGHNLRPIKTRRTLTSDVPVETKLVDNTDERLARDADLWNAFPPVNFFQNYRYGMGSNDSKSNWPRLGAGGLTPQEIADKYGDWSPRVPALGDTILVNQKLGLKYTLSDYRSGKPLPDPYPFKDYGDGVWTPPEKAGEDPQNFWPVADGMSARMRDYETTMGRDIEAYRKGNAAAGRDAALMLCRMAYDFPTITARNTMHAVVIQPGSWGRDHGCRRRDPATGFLADVDIDGSYDMLFDLIKSDQGLADSLHRFIPSIKTPQDVTAFLDDYLVQTTAERCLRYHTYSSNEPSRILTPAICLADTEYTRPWLDWLFSSTFIYPLPPSGIQDLLVSGNDRDGIGYIGSHFYSHGEQCAPKAMDLEEYIRYGGDKKYDLSNPVLYPKPLAACYWYIDAQTAGNWFLPIGDVCGPDKGYGHPLYNGSLEAQCAIGWKWSKDPKFAWFLSKAGDRKGWTDEQWAEIQKAADALTRSPFWENRSRVIINWAGLLESGVEYSDPRFRRSVMVRIGQGYGHAHADTLDLQVHAHGYSMTIDGGQRPGYTKPGDSTTRTHNLVEVDGRNWVGHSWVNTLTDVEGARYLSAQAEPPANHPDTKLYRRQVALIDVDRGGEPEPPVTGTIGLDAPSPNSYVFDVVRVSGGSTHTYCFHAMLEDELTSNVEDRVKLDALQGDAKSYAAMFHRDVAEFPESSAGFAGVAPDVLQATWRMIRDPQGIARTEQSANPAIWDPKSPRKYTRLLLLGQKGAQVMTGWSHCTQWKYGWTNLFTQRQGQALESVFPALIEPYVGEPFIADQKLLTIADNDTDALKAVAVELKTKNGHTDLCFADGRPDKERVISGTGFQPVQAAAGAPIKVSAEFAYLSYTSTGSTPSTASTPNALREATLTGGTLLEAPGLRIAPASRERTAKISAVDYNAKQMTLDRSWPAAALLANRVFESGVPGHMTTYTIASAADQAGATRLNLTEGADFYLSRVEQVDPAQRLVTCALAFTYNDKAPCPGVDKHWVAANEDMTKFWRAEYLGDVDGSGRYAFRLDGPVADQDFGKLKGFRLWEYGAGDEVRQSTFASVRRLDNGDYEVQADIDVEVTLPGAGVEISPDGQAWTALKAQVADGKATVTLTPANLGTNARTLLRVR